MPNFFGCRKREMSDTPDVSGSSKGEAWDTFNTLDSRGTESWHRHNASGSRREEILERQCRCTDSRKTTAEGTRHASDTSRQPSAYGDQTSIMKELFEMMEEISNKMKALFERIIQILLNTNKEKEENEMLKERIKKLEARNQDLLAKAMAMHQYSEDINDPSHLSAVLERYEILRLQEWEKVRLSCHWTYEEGSHIIRKLFDACEKDIQQRTDDILKALDISPWNASTKVTMQDIMKLLRQHYRQNSMIYNRIVQEADIHTGTENAIQFLLQCCQIYCLLLLRDPPVKAEWEMNTMYLEHVDKKDVQHWEKTSFLWPIMKCGEEMIVKGVVWDQGKMF